MLKESLRETKKKTLEEIGVAFGDKVVLVTETDIAVEEAIMEGKGGEQHIELARPAAA